MTCRRLPQTTALALYLFYWGVSWAQQGARIPAATSETATLDLREFVPRDARLVKSARIDFANNGIPSVVLVYGFDTVPMISTGLRVLAPGSTGWSVKFEEENAVINGAGPNDAIDIEKVRCRSGKEGVVVVLKNSGAGTTTDWHLLASVGNKLVRLDPSAIRAKGLERRGSLFMGYNDLRVNDDLIIEDVPGYSPNTARCCPDKPTLEIAVRFTGTSLRLAHVKEIPLQ